MESNYKPICQLINKLLMYNLVYVFDHPSLTDLVIKNHILFINPLFRSIAYNSLFGHFMVQVAQICYTNTSLLVIHHQESNIQIFIKQLSHIMNYLS